MTTVLGLDFGTNGARAGVFDLAARRMLATGEEGYPTAHIPPDRCEQGPEDWWAALRRLLPRVLAAAGHPRIEAVTVATFSSTVVVCGRDGTPLAPAILWMDARAWAEAARTAKVAHPVLDYSGGSDAVEWLVPKAMWLKAHQPELWSRTGVICEALDWVNHRLTGRWVGSLMNATCKWNYDSRARSFCPDLYEALGVPELMDKLPPEILDIGAPIGPMTAEAAEALGLPGRPLVVQGGIDAHMGTFGADTVTPGSMLLIGGTSNVHLTQVPDDGTRIAGVWGPYPHALTPGLRMIEGGQVSAGSILNWLVRDIYGLDGAGFAALNAAAEGIPPRGTGLLALDYWMGNRTPYRDPNLRGAILGLSLSHDRAGIYRALVNAVALGSANVVFDLARQGVAIDRIVLAGGIMKNPLWLRATVDALGMPVGIAREDNLSLYGGAVAAATGLGLHPSLTEAAAAYRAPVTVMEPDMSRHEEYLALLQDYRDATERLAPILHALSGDTGTRS
ncbi:FGGY-family carbohydrate kinase [Rubellimicrobium arenae]|uniref:FGGY-family carbohydrate kinase n=1 Tax=Rubellimicrobium arenae TaxID=2817372 RepID=UPI001B31035C|nr:FGGY-family carbohydrate kinase [Rubellimicrobium arenae]